MGDQEKLECEHRRRSVDTRVLRLLLVLMPVDTPAELLIFSALNELKCSLPDGQVFLIFCCIESLHRRETDPRVVVVVPIRIFVLARKNRIAAG